MRCPKSNRRRASPRRAPGLAHADLGQEAAGMGGPADSECDCSSASAWIGGDPQPRWKTVSEQLKAERPHRGGPQPIETGGARWGVGAFAATTEAARVSVPSADP